MLHLAGTDTSVALPLFVWMAFFGKVEKKKTIKFNEAALFQGFSEGGSLLTLRTRGVYVTLRRRFLANVPI